MRPFIIFVEKFAVLISIFYLKALATSYLDGTSKSLAVGLVMDPTPTANFSVSVSVGTSLLATAQGTLIYLFSSSTLNQVSSLSSGHTQSITSLVSGTMTDSAPVLITGSLDYTCRVFNTNTMSSTPLATMTAHTGPIKIVVLLGDGATAVSTSTDGTIKVWNITTGVVRTTISVTHVVCLAAVSNSLVLSGDSTGSIRVSLFFPSFTGHLQKITADSFGDLIIVFLKIVIVHVKLLNVCKITECE
jgi:WD40 repeat protein